VRQKPTTQRLIRTGALALLGAILLGAALLDGAPAQDVSAEKFAHGRHGMVAASTPYATAAGVRLLESGGNAVDAAAAAAFALMVTDPPMTSLAGRTQILIFLCDGTVAGIDGSTQAPARIPPLASGEDRQGHQVVPVPGNPAALAEAVRKYGKKKLAEVLAPAIELAEHGFRVTPGIGSIWVSTRERLARNSGAAQSYLKEDGSAYQPGDVFSNPRLARALRQIAESGPKAFYRGAAAQAMVRDARENGGYLQPRDLREFRALRSVVHRTTYRSYEVLAVGRRAWGGTLMEMLNILDHFTLGPGEPTAEEIEILARSVAQAIADRPQEVGTLKPKPQGVPLEEISSREFAGRRAEQIKRQLTTPPQAMAPDKPVEPGETTHLAVMDAEGNAVSLTTSIGPRFGARVASPELGFLYAHSYRMRSDPTPLARDETEMTPTIVLRNGRPVLAIGAAGSERIPAAILQVISNVIDRGQPLHAAVNSPRIFCLGNKLRLDARFSPTVAAALRRRGFDVEVTPHELSRHLGIVHAVQYDPRTGEYLGTADPVYDGAAAGPARSPVACLPARR